MYYVYILTNHSHSIFYTGMTDEVVRRDGEHKYGKYDGFTKKFSVDKLVYFERHETFKQASHREQIVKKWKRKFKIDAINNMNPDWVDLYRVMTHEAYDETL